MDAKYRDSDEGITSEPKMESVIAYVNLNMLAGKSVIYLNLLSVVILKEASN